MDLAINADFAHAPRDELRVLRAEIEDQDPMGVDVRRRRLDGLELCCGPVRW
jgi:hypothetical protein